MDTAKLTEVTLLTEENNDRDFLNYKLDLRFKSASLQENNLVKRGVGLKLLGRKSYEHILKKTKPSFEMMREVVTSFNKTEDLLQFLVKHIKCIQGSEVDNLSYFILQDIELTIRDAFFTEDEWNSFQSIAGGNLRTDELYGSNMDWVDKLFAGYRNSTSLGTAKPAILALLKQVRPGWQPKESLHNESCAILTDAILFVPSEQLKTGLNTAVEDGVITHAWDDDLRDFIYDRTQDPMECGLPEG